MSNGGYISHIRTGPRRLTGVSVSSVQPHVRARTMTSCHDKGPSALLAKRRLRCNPLDGTAGNVRSLGGSRGIITVRAGSNLGRRYLVCSGKGSSGSCSSRRLRERQRREHGRSRRSGRRRRQSRRAKRVDARAGVGPDAAAPSADTLSDGVEVRERQESCWSAGDRARRGGKGQLTGLWPLRAWIRLEIASRKVPGTD